MDRRGWAACCDSHGETVPIIRWVEPNPLDAGSLDASSSIIDSCIMIAPRQGRPTVTTLASGLTHRQRRIVRGFCCTGALLATAVAVVLFTTSATAAQAQDREDRVLPREIETNHLALYCRLLNLSDAQSAAAQQAYQEYVKAYATLDLKVLETYGDDLTPQSTIDDLLARFSAHQRSAEAARDRIRAADRAFFAQIQLMLDDSQLARMERVRNHRERCTLRVLRCFYLTGKRFYDASSFVYDLDVTVEDWDLLDPILVEYERQLTARLKELHALALELDIEPIREIVRRGLGVRQIAGINDAYRDAAITAWSTVGERCLKAVREIDDFNESTSRRIVNTLSVEGGHRWLDEYMPRAHDGTVWTRSRRRAILDSIASARGVTAEDDRRFREAFAAVDARLEVLQDELIALEDSWRPRRSPYFDRESGMPFDDYVATRERIISDLKEVIAQFSEALRYGLRPVIYDQWQAAFADATTRKSDVTTHPGGEAIVSVHNAPLFMSRRDLQRIESVLALAEDARAVIEEAYSSYQASQTGIEEDLLSQELNDFGDVPPLTAELRSRIRRLDEGLIGAIDRLCPDDECRRRLRWFANARVRKLLGHGVSSWMADGIDAAVYMFDSHLAPEEIGRLGDLLDRYDAEAGVLFEKLYEARCLEYEDELANPGGQSSYQFIDGRRQCHRAIARLNVMTIREAAELLKSPTGNAMLEAFNRHCFYFIVVDEGRLDTAFRRVALLEDLTTDQRGRLLDLNVTYQQEYDRLTEQMLDLVKDSVYWHGGARWEVPDSPRGERRVEAYNDLMFKRVELNAATNLKIKSILTPAQLESIGGLPDMR